MKNKNLTTGLKNPNDPSSGRCYAPVVNGGADLSKRRHIEEGRDPPENWIMVPCPKSCR